MKMTDPAFMYFPGLTVKSFAGKQSNWRKCSTNSGDCFLTSAITGLQCMKPFGERFRSFWAHETSLTILLFVLSVHIFIMIPLGEETTFIRVISQFFYMALLLAGMFMLLKSRGLRIVGFVLLTLLILSMFFGSSKTEVADNLVIAAYCLLLSWVVLLRTFSEGPITIHRVLGAVVVYLLISFVFTMLYQSTYLIYGESAFKGLSSSDRKEFMYFSLTTLTTVGYGDISPALPANRSLSNLEALIGQLYPAILIARLVSMEFESSRTKRAK